MYHVSALPLELGIKPRALGTICNHSTSGLHPESCISSAFKNLVCVMYVYVHMCEYRHACVPWHVAVTEQPGIDIRIFIIC